jgi:DNA-binding MarR family transcriptional regulator
MPPMRRKKMTDKVSSADLRELSEFRYRLRRFLRYSEEIVHEEGVTPQQYMLMLHTRAFADRDWATVGELAERLQASSHGTVALVTRCEAAGLVVRVASAHDRRQVQVHLTPEGERRLMKLAVLHKSEVQSFGWAFRDEET